MQNRIHWPSVSSIAILVAAAVAGCSSDEPPSSGCSTDVECKGDRICEAGVCVDPAGSGGGSNENTSAGGTSSTSTTSNDASGSGGSDGNAGGSTTAGGDGGTSGDGGTFGEGGSGTETICDVRAALMRECGALDVGRFQCRIFGDALEACQTECYRTATCEDYELTRCTEVPRGPLSDCLSECRGPRTWECDDGTVISVGDVCDLTEDCADGSDESDCPEGVNPGLAAEKCRNTDEWYLDGGDCDGQQHCSDGSDEADCELQFRCASGNDSDRPIFRFDICDGFDDCNDGSDEEGDCAQVASCSP